MRNAMRRMTAASAITLLLATAAAAAGPTVDWPTYGGDPGGTRYSPLTQITARNVSRLKEAWRLEMPAGGVQVQPVVVGRTMYVTTTDQKVMALDAATGKTIWSVTNTRPNTPGFGGPRQRGASWWQSGNEKRLFINGGAFVYALDPDTGARITSFGEDGAIDLRKNLRGDNPALNFVNMGSPVTIYKDLLITGGGVAERSPASPGDIRAYDVRTGALKWTFHTIPHPGEFGYETWPADAYTKLGGANNWAGAVIDDKRGILYVPTGSAADDFAGVERLGDNLFANTLIAIDANTGKRLWHFQAVRHDLWDYDFATPPVLLTVTHKGKKVDAVAATNKLGFVYLFNRVTGESLFPIDEVATTPSSIPGDVAAKTQPVPRLPAPIARQTLTADSLTTRTPEAAAWALEKFKTFYGGDKQFIPPRLGQETIAAPGFSGGVEWGGMAANPKGILFANSENIVWTTAVRPNPPPPANAPPGFRSAYGFSGYNKFYDPDGYPASSTPWGTLNAIDMNTGKYLWRIPFGEYPELVAKGMKDTGSESYGGPVVTASGLLFIGATIYDSKLRAFDASNGKLLWETVMPFAGTATPAVYMVDGKQYITIGISGARNSKGPKGAMFISYALPD